MKCLLCKNGTTVAGKTEVTLIRGDFKIVARNVPSIICKDCSEEYITDETSAILLNFANESIRKGNTSLVCNFSKETPTQK